MWTSFDLDFVKYMVPVVVVVSTLQNMFAIATFFGMNKGIGHKTRTLFMALAITDLFNILVWYGVAAFANHGLYNLSEGTFYFNDIFQNEIACKLLPALGHFGLFCSHWLYVFVNADRVIAVLRPHRSQRSRIRHRLRLAIGFLIFVGLLTAVLTALLNSANVLAAAIGTLFKVKIV